MEVRALTAEGVAWFQSRTLECPLTPDARGIEAIDKSGKVAAAVIFDTWAPSSAWVHIAIDNPAALRRLLSIGFSFIFIHASKKILLGRIAASNAKSRRLAESLGFCELYRIPDGHDLGVDLCIYGMRASECRYLGPQRKAA